MPAKKRQPSPFTEHIEQRLKYKTIKTFIIRLGSKFRNDFLTDCRDLSDLLVKHSYDDAINFKTLDLFTRSKVAKPTKPARAPSPPPPQQPQSDEQVDEPDTRPKYKDNVFTNAIKGKIGKEDIIDLLTQLGEDRKSLSTIDGQSAPALLSRPIHKIRYPRWGIISKDAITEFINITKEKEKQRDEALFAKLTQEREQKRIKKVEKQERKRELAEQHSREREQ